MRASFLVWQMPSTTSQVDSNHDSEHDQRSVTRQNKRAAHMAACRNYRHKKRNEALQFEAAMIDIDNTREDIDNTILLHSCGTMSAKCQHCGALFYPDEKLTKSTAANAKFGMCCCNGAVKLWPVPNPPEPLLSLLTCTSTKSRKFRQDIRKYNCALCLASMRANEIKFNSGPSVYKVHGEIYRYLGPLHESAGQAPKCLQTFFVDAKMQADLGNERFGANDEEAMTSLVAMLQANNSYVKSFVTIDE